MDSGRSPLLTVLLCVPALLAMIGLTADSALAQDDQLNELFNEGKAAFDKGQYDDALQKFQQILAENPSNEMAFHFWEDAGHKIFLEMLIREGEYETVARRFIELARVGRKEKQDDSTRITELAGMLTSGDYREKKNALQELFSNHGEFAVEYLYMELSNENVEARINVINGLSRMGEEVTLPVAKVLCSDDEVIKRNASVVLGKVKDVRAVPALKKVTEDQALSQTTRDAAAEALSRTTGKDPAGLPSAAELFCQQADDYLMGNDMVTKPFLPSTVIWKWRNGQLVKMPVPAGLRDLELAEDACYNALDCDPGNVKAVTLLAAVCAAQVAEINATDPGEDDSEAMTYARESLGSGGKLMALCGPDRLKEALGFCLERKLYPAAKEVIDVLGRTGVLDADILNVCLGSEDKLVRYKSAFAAAGSGLVNSDTVKTVAAALGETSVRQVLVIDNNEETRVALVEGLNKSGFFAVSSGCGASGLSRAKEFPPKDLVIVRAGLSNLTLDQIVFEMASGATSETPIVILCDDEGVDGVKGIWEEKVAGFLTTSEALGGGYLETVRSSLGELNDARQKALALSVEAAKILAGLDSGAIYPVVNDLVKALDKADDVKIPVLQALTKVGTKDALEKAAAIFSDTSAAVEVRVAAANALGTIFFSEDVDADADLLAALSEAAVGDDPALRFAAGEALGKATNLMNDEDMKELLISNRID